MPATCLGAVVEGKRLAAQAGICSNTGTPIAPYIPKTAHVCRLRGVGRRGLRGAGQPNDVRNEPFAPQDRRIRVSVVA